ncbi:MAG: hypothetical protein EP330_01035 [Deltaproteobacteria bacterium]|nr:MAG: hypothetical protein EP330_01035 [Deltaproteobacteria bacterium]
MSGSLPQSTRQFHFMREIAAGGFGSVYLAKIIHADGFSRLAAIKLLHPKWSEHEEIVKRMRDEARLLGWLRHRNIVDVLDLTMIDGRCAVIMEYLEAVDLKLVIKSATLREERIPIRVSLEIAAAVASALDAAYNRPPYAGEKPLRVIHRDIKPSNVMVDDSGTPKVLDFGVARADFDSRESHTQELSFGSLDYMPPERLFFEPETNASDIYSLGATLYELVVLDRMGKGKLSRDAQDEHVATRLQKLDEAFPEVDGAIREELADLLFEMLSFEPEERPTAASTVDRLRGIARKLRDEPSLSEWAEREIPPLVQAFHQARPKGEPDPLIERTLNEDSRPFGRWATEEAEPELRDELPEPTDHAEELDEAVKLPEDDQRWQKLKEATLAEISEEVSHRAMQTFEVDPTPPKGIGLGAAHTFEVDHDDSATIAFSDSSIFTEWEEDESPTVAFSAEDVRMASLIESQVPEEWGDAADELDDAPTTESRPPALPPTLKGRKSAEVYTAPFARPKRNSPAPEPPAPPSKSTGSGAPERVPTAVGGAQTLMMKVPKREEVEPSPVPVARRGREAIAMSTIDEERDSGDVAAPSGGRSLVGTLLSLVIAAGVMLVFGTVGIGIGVAAMRSVKGPDALGAMAAPVEAAAAPAPAPEPPPVDDTPLAEGEARFDSGLAATKKLVVTCGADKVTGGESARIQVGEGAECMVTAIGTDRSRKTAKLAATATHYVCFADGGEDCIDPEAPAEEGGEAAPSEGDEGTAP